jgi:hypothetical protein
MSNQPRRAPPVSARQTWLKGVRTEHPEFSEEDIAAIAKKYDDIKIEVGQDPTDYQRRLILADLIVLRSKRNLDEIERKLREAREGRDKDNAEAAAAAARAQAARAEAEKARAEAEKARASMPGAASGTSMTSAELESRVDAVFTDVAARPIVKKALRGETINRRELIKIHPDQCKVAKEEFKASICVGLFQLFEDEDAPGGGRMIPAKNLNAAKQLPWPPAACWRRVTDDDGESWYERKDADGSVRSEWVVPEGDNECPPPSAGRRRKTRHTRRRPSRKSTQGRRTRRRKTSRRKQ